MNSVYMRLCWTALLLFGLPAFAQMDQDIVRLDLKDHSRNGPPDTLPVYIEIATVQPDVEQGIVFTLNIENNGKNTVRIIDPIDTISIGLTGFTQPFTSSLRDTKPDYLTCYIGSFSPESLKAIHDDKMAKRPFQVFDVNGARQNRNLKTVNDIVPWERPPHQSGKAPHKTKQLSEIERFDGRVGGKLTLEPGEHFQAVLQVTRVYSDYKAYKKARDQWISDFIIPNEHGLGTTAPGAPPRPEPEIIPIPADKYYFSVSISLLTDNKGNYAASTAASTGKSITIQLGEASQADQKDTNRP